MKPLRPRTLLLSLVIILLGGTVFFHLVEGWGWVDSYFFTVVTVSTVGYGNIVPATALGKIGATLFIFFGLGVFALAIHQFTYFNMLWRERQTEWLFALLHQRNGHGQEKHEGGKHAREGRGDGRRDREGQGVDGAARGGPGPGGEAGSGNGPGNGPENEDEKAGTGDGPAGGDDAAAGSGRQ